jgi:PPOX class probable F420-dependent enzyme
MNQNLTQFANQNFLNLETSRKTGEVLKTPVWFVQTGESLYVRTLSNSGKVKRIQHQPEVRVMPCGQSGEPLGAWAAAQARELPDAETYARVGKLLLAKYGEIVTTFEQQAHEKGLKYTVVEIKILV